MWPGDGVILAVGQASGRVSLVSFREGEGRFLLERGDLSPRTSRGCSAGNNKMASDWSIHIT